MASQVELPKISTFTQILAMPEIQFENMAKSAGVELPPGPQSTLLKLQSSIEAGQTPSPEALLSKVPKVEEVLSKLPKLPPLPGTESVSSVSQGDTVKSADETKAKTVTYGGVLKVA